MKAFDFRVKFRETLSPALDTVDQLIIPPAERVRAQIPAGLQSRLQSGLKL
jgi:hypothetical protein